MTLATSCRPSFAQEIIHRGEEYYKDGAVDVAAAGLNRVAAFVKGSGDDYHVVVDWSESGVVSMSCSCPHFGQGFLCKHLWATALGVDELGSANHLQGISIIQQLRLDEIIDPSGDGDLDSWNTDLDDEHGGRSEWELRLEEALSAPSKRDADNSHRQVFSQQSDETWIELNLQNCLQAGRVELRLFRRQHRADDGEPQAWKLDRSDLCGVHNLQERQLLAILFEIVSGSQLSNFIACGDPNPPVGKFTISEDRLTSLLRELAHFPRFVWRHNDDTPVTAATPIRWDSQEKWNLRFRLEEVQEKQAWLLTGEIVGSDACYPLSEILFRLSDEFLLMPEKLIHLENGRQAAHWLSACDEMRDTLIPFEDRVNLLRFLAGAPALEYVDLPESLQAEVSTGTATPRIRFQRERHALLGSVDFCYAQTSFQAFDNVAGHYDDATSQLVLRDLPLERTHLKTVAQHSSRFYRDDYAETDSLQFTASDLPELIEQFTQAGWIVEAEGRRVRRAENFNIQVKSQIDWFEVTAQLDFDGHEMPLPFLLAALRQKENFIRLDDGSLGILPEKWLKQMEVLSELGLQAGDGVLQFKPSQALLLDALLTAQPNVDFDRKYQEIRRKLASFAGVKPKKEPASFQGTLRPYQQDGLGWLHFLQDFNLGGCLADDMGLGKTVQVLALLESRRKRRMTNGETRQPSIVVVPKSLIFNWIAEAQRFTPRLNVLDYTGTDRKVRLEDAGIDVDLLLTTYGTLRRDIAHLQDQKFDYAILDEAQAIKNASSQASKAARLLNADYRLAMTGTPVENHLGELWALFEFLNPGMLGSSTKFAKLTKQIDDDKTIAKLAQGLRPFLLRRTKEEVLVDLPKKTEQTLFCEMAAKQKKAYHELRDYYRAQLGKTIADKGMAKSKIHVLEALLRLRQAACHPGLIDEKNVDNDSAKLQVLLEQIEEVIDEGHKVLVFSQFTKMLAIVKKQLDRRKIPYEYLDGQTRKRGEKVERFQTDPDCPLFLISLKAGGQGLNLTAADYVYILDPWWNPAVEAQAIDRAHRWGQEKPVFAYRLICKDTVEEKILELQGSKQKLVDAIISADGSLLQDLTSEDLQLLLS